MRILLVTGLAATLLAFSAPASATAASAEPEAPSISLDHTSVDVPDTPPESDGLPLFELLAGLGIVGLGIVNGNLGGQVVERREIRAGSHLGPDVTGKLAPDIGFQKAGEVLGWDSYADDAALRPALLGAEAVGTGDGTKKTFPGSFESALEPRTVKIVAADKTLQDDGSGRLYGDGTGTVNYATGEYSAAFTAAPANNVAVTGRALREIAGPLLRDADPSFDGVVAVGHHGTYNLSNMTAGGQELPIWVRRALIRRGIYGG